LLIQKSHVWPSQPARLSQPEYVVVVDVVDVVVVDVVVVDVVVVDVVVVVVVVEVVVVVVDDVVVVVVSKDVPHAQPLQSQLSLANRLSQLTNGTGLGYVFVIQKSHVCDLHPVALLHTATEVVVNVVVVDVVVVVVVEDDVVVVDVVDVDVVVVDVHSQPRQSQPAASRLAQV